MTMTDPIADMLTRLRNASAAKHETVDMPYSKFKAAIAQILKREGYIADFEAKEARVGRTLQITLKYGPHGERSIEGIKRVSKPGLRRYAKSDSLPMPLGGLGVAIISTSSGLMTQKECLDRGIGGEIVAYVW
ncbi:30S ribosomal protein S8 [Bifidobacterium actinocoloniiforme DSM 22766]|uniref:Small ribosomal subunit protein uS8 n=1 Tax=Bifidobacterium actinocoloniiforme DSM 22766 TaxID=1437605 RepID=A0A086YYR1_9BIFI|nr:30S ribosomal protein S8 [Bifidobacterium actinocoloniiforme]AKV55933.1 30S ribosomal protein S8 [Bifidobacterium actinocoloniiforme DSM 22766]KFI39411.1 30S ribosomal protein S8 [Bifidobacterium actinocoloniiforme DSM 22766]